MPSTAIAGNRYAALLSESGSDDAAEPRTAKKVKAKRKVKRKVPPEGSEAMVQSAFEPSPSRPNRKRKKGGTEGDKQADGAQKLEEDGAQEKHETGDQQGPLPLGAEKTLPGGVTIKVLRAAPADAVIATKGCEVRLIYEGRLAKNNRRFDNGEIDFLLGDGTMLPGFAKGVSGMGVGERRLIHIPWKLGYGKKGKKPKIPPMSDLDFDASLTFCGVDWKERSNRSEMSNKRREAAKRRGKKPRPT
ncbi:unnamed protein product [Cladocopium goreaui]|uniref:peptidylprolyl isomerase n=1 Tax=Cladocopium goreaui TaxID=2562237 RepID=A0A9P1CPC6_9DINO|nr:unnamed protein product [Cladocopium goreaui]